MRADSNGYNAQMQQKRLQTNDFSLKERIPMQKVQCRFEASPETSNLLYKVQCSSVYRVYPNRQTHQTHQTDDMLVRRQPESTRTDNLLWAIKPSIRGGGFSDDFFENGIEWVDIAVAHELGYTANFMLRAAKQLAALLNA